MVVEGSVVLVLATFLKPIMQPVVEAIKIRNHHIIRDSLIKIYPSYDLSQA